MNATIRPFMMLAVIFSCAGATALGQTGGADVYKAKCQSCHGATGTPSAAMAKMMGIKAVSDPDIKKLTADDMIAAVKNGKGKMQPFKDKLTDDQIKDSVTYYRTLK
jgi:mono/diheme cytochrome c family protein